MLEGYLISANECVVQGKTQLFVTLYTPHFLASVVLTDYYRSFVKELIARASTLPGHHLLLRLYHLPAPTIDEEQGEPLHRYVATPYTLAVLEPDTLLNITDLAQANYCERQYLLHRLISSPPSAATVRGNLVHHCFKELLKYHDRGALMQQRVSDMEPLAFMLEQLRTELQRTTVDLALAHMTPETMYAEVVPHLESLAIWYQRERSTLWDMPAAYNMTELDEQALEGNRVRAETFLLAPELGLRGRLDLFWQQAGRQRLLELKTGGARGDLPKPDHRWQVYGYHAQLTVRRTSQMKKALATLVYSGTPLAAQSFGIPFTLRELHRVNAVRNILVLQHITGIPVAPPGSRRCSRCALLQQCERVSLALNWQLPQPESNVESRTMHQSVMNQGVMNQGVMNQAPTQIDSENDETPAKVTDSDTERAFFARYYRLLMLEGHEAERQQALLWNEDVEAREKRGGVIRNLQLQGEPVPTGKGEWLQTFACTNGSELRKGDEVLLSNGDPIHGEVVTGTIMEISAQHVTLWTPELIAHPTLLDRYSNDQVHVRTLQNLTRWLDVESHMRDLVAGRVRPRFVAREVVPRPDFNHEQNLALASALHMQDYLLIQGPPGTGKTSVIAEIVKRLVQQGQRVLLAAFTNQAVDNMLKRLAEKEHFFEYVRLGHERSADESEHISSHLLQNMLKISMAVDDVETDAHESVPTTSALSREITLARPRADVSPANIDLVRALLQTSPVVASTTATWSSDKYSPRLLGEDAETPLSFDVAIIDEASQLTIPALLGALRFAKRFILVGDEQQLPPLVLSKQAAEEGLADSLFSLLKRLDADYMHEHPQSVSACVPLLTQYRMNAWIAQFASKIFYDGVLQTGEQNANARLRLLNERALIAREATEITRAINPLHPLIFLHVERDRVEKQLVKTSQAEAEAVRRIVVGLLARGVAPSAIGIIAPYRAQVARLRHTLFSGEHMLNIAPTALTIDTVDRFQGGERSVIIISFATTTEPQGDMRDFLTNSHRLNVALTRAQHKLILVGYVPALENLPIFSRLIAYCRSMKTLIG